MVLFENVHEERGIYLQKKRPFHEFFKKVAVNSDELFCRKCSFSDFDFAGLISSSGGRSIEIHRCAYLGS